MADGAERLLLRPWEAGDAGALAAAWADPDVAAHTEVPAEPTEAHAARWIEGWSARADGCTALDLVVAPASAPTDVWGEVGLWVLTDGGERRVGDLGWWVRADRRGRGVASTAVARLAAWALSTDGAGFAQVVARIDRGHAASEALAGRLGFRRVGRLDATRDLWTRVSSLDGPVG